MSVHFLLVRHAMKERAVGDVGITSLGEQQAHLTAQHLQSLPITAVVSSPLRRAQETAAIIAQKTHAMVRTDQRLRERANWGDLPGQSFEAFVAMWDRCTREPDYLPPVGDSVKQASERMDSLLKELAIGYPTGSYIVIVTHGGLITDYLTQAFEEDLLNTYHPRFVSEQSQLIAECSITQLSFGEQRFSITRFATVEHLQTLNNAQH